MKIKVNSRKRRCPACNVGTGSAHNLHCIYAFTGYPNQKTKNKPLSMDKIKILLINKYSNQILELVELQCRNDENSLTQSDLQGAIDAIVMNILREEV